MRNVSKVKGFIKVFRPHFGKMKLSRITYADILDFRNHRLTVPTHYKRERNIATMNREISCLRRIFNIAVRQGWIVRNPVTSGEPLIDISAERRRERILTLDEERRLLSVCKGRRKHLRAVVICLLDTGARCGETLKLRFSDLDFEQRLITYQALNTKTLKTRRVAMTERVYNELLTMSKECNGRPNDLVFGIKSIFRSFEAACKEAGIETGRPYGITPHSLRHTAATRLVNGQMSIQMVGRILSHQSPEITYRYLSANDETLYQAASILESVQRE
jgi:integrase